VTRDPAAPYACAKANDQAQRAAFPDWWYAVSHGGKSNAPLGAPEPFHVGFEPLLEAVPGCNGLTGELAGGLKEFRFLVVLDGSWVSYFNSRKAAFVAQGYPTLESSANLMLDRASFLFEAQFGSRVSASRVFAFPDLGEACATNNNHVDDGSDATSTAKALESANVVATSAEAGTIRLGVGSLTAGQYCHSTAGIGGLCRPSSTLTNQRTPFQASSDHIDHGAVKTLAHELAHFFGVCDDATNPDCLNGHTANEIADIMVDDGRPASNVRAEGMFWKFMPTCTDVYDDMVCSRVQAASPSCGRVLPPAKEPTTATLTSTTVTATTVTATTVTTATVTATTVTATTVTTADPQPSGCDASTFVVDSRFIGGSVCASTMASGNCERKVTISQARSRCKAAGARLCSETEVKASVARKLTRQQPCKINGKPVWTSTSCTRADGIPGTTVTRADGKNGRKDSCIPLRNRLATRALLCCSDVAGDQP
jgi:hypothetical protein